MEKLDNPKLQQFIENPKKGLWKMTMPFLLGLTVNSLYMLVDTMFVGKFVPNSKAALDAMGLVFPLMFIVMGLTFGLGSGATTLIAQFIGAKDTKSANSVASHTILIGIILPLIIISIVLILGENIIQLQLNNNTDKDTLVFAKDYFHIISLGTIFMVPAIFFRSILSGEGETLFPMKILGIGTALNIILDPIFIITFNLEVAGAAIATVISHGFVALTFVYFLLFKKISYIKISFRKNAFKFDFKVIKTLFRIGIPASLSFAIMSLGMFVNNHILSLADDNASLKLGCNQYISENNCLENHCNWQDDKNDSKCFYKKGGVVGGYQTATRLENLVLIPIIALSSSLVTMIGMFHGLKRYDLIRSIINYSLKWSVLLTLISTFIFFTFSSFLLKIFTNDLKVISEGIIFFNVVSFSFPFVAIGMITCRAMQGMNRPIPFLFLTLLRVILIAIPMAWIGVQYYDKNTEWIWWSVLLSSIISAFASLYWMYKIMRNNEAHTT